MSETKSKPTITEVETSDAFGKTEKVKWDETHGGVVLSKVEAISTEEADKAAGAVLPVPLPKQETPKSAS